jgi:hypothetical protein
VSKNYLRRYTDIPALVSLLTERKITLLDPASWDDKNDSRFLDLYQGGQNATRPFVPNDSIRKELAGGRAHLRHRDRFG